MSRAAVFLDRDGVLVEDHGLPVDVAAIPIPEGVPSGLATLAREGYALIVITNQAVIARGWETPEEVVAGQAVIGQRLEDLGAPAIDGLYFCPHHPHATLEAYRVDCDCRKPAPGLLLQAAREHDIDLARSVFIGDRPSDIAAGRASGCRTVLLRTGAHEAPSIVSTREVGDVTPDLECDTFTEAEAWILDQREVR